MSAAIRRMFARFVPDTGYTPAIWVVCWASARYAISHRHAPDLELDPHLKETTLNANRVAGMSAAQHSTVRLITLFVGCWLRFDECHSIKSPPRLKRSRSPR
jgi:hypothetical protein